MCALSEKVTRGLKNSLSRPIPLNADPGAATVSTPGKSAAAEGEVAPVASIGIRCDVRKWILTWPVEMAALISVAAGSKSMNKASRGQ
jgi:hypothetical protein